ncbi:hypothetical protein B2J88_52105 [Rhodococcus sp. SRB_17]|nr:hypothetical protein [Rhodococcus sp. SRB_17]
MRDRDGDLVAGVSVPTTPMVQRSVAPPGPEVGNWKGEIPVPFDTMPVAAEAVGAATTRPAISPVHAARVAAIRLKFKVSLLSGWLLLLAAGTAFVVVFATGRPPIELNWAWFGSEYFR